MHRFFDPCPGGDNVYAVGRFYRAFPLRGRDYQKCHSAASVLSSTGVSMRWVAFVAASATLFVRCTEPCPLRRTISTIGQTRMSEQSHTLQRKASSRDKNGLSFPLSHICLEDRNHFLTSTNTLSCSVPRNGPCLTLRHCMSSMIRMPWTPRISTIASPG